MDDPSKLKPCPFCGHEGKACIADNALMDDIGELLSELSAYFDNKSDFQDGDYGTQEPNAELRHYAAIEALLKRIGG